MQFVRQTATNPGSATHPLGHRETYNETHASYTITSSESWRSSRPPTTNNGLELSESHSGQGKPLAFERVDEQRELEQFGRENWHRTLKLLNEIRQLSHDPRGCRHIQSVTATSDIPSVLSQPPHCRNKLEYNNAQLELVHSSHQPVYMVHIRRRVTASSPTTS